MKLIEIQQQLKAPKSQVNSFGNYKYRNCEDILEALKPLLSSPLTITDEIVMVGTRYYVKATATYDGVSVTAYAREAEIKKGMDEAQITGSASSYARKYALNGLFAIDDSKDADTQDNRQNVTTGPVKAVQPSTAPEATTGSIATINTTPGGPCPVCHAPYSKPHAYNCSTLKG